MTTQETTSVTNENYIMQTISNTIGLSTLTKQASVTSLPSDGLILKVRIPSMAGYQTKKFNRNVTVKEVIEKLNNSLPANLRSDRYHLFANGMRLIDESRTLNSYTNRWV
jgi:hypothetical protein